MSANVYVQHTADGRSHMARRSVRQGRRPSGLGKPVLVRLYAEDEQIQDRLQERLGRFYNRNQIIRDAVAAKRSIYTELLNH